MPDARTADNNPSRLSTAQEEAWKICCLNMFGSALKPDAESVSLFRSCFIRGWKAHCSTKQIGEYQKAVEEVYGEDGASPKSLNEYAGRLAELNRENSSLIERNNSQANAIENLMKENRNLQAVRDELSRQYGGWQAENQRLAGLVEEAEAKAVEALKLKDTQTSYDLPKIIAERNTLQELVEKHQDLNKKCYDLLNLDDDENTPESLYGALVYWMQQREESGYLDKSTYQSPAEYEEQCKQDRLDLFATAALTGLLAYKKGGTDTEAHVADAYDCAEAMEAERAKRVNQGKPDSVSE